jgi:flagellar protein FlaF
MVQDTVAKYQRVSEANAPPREIELTAFGLVNRLLAEPQDERRRVKALGKNHELWSLLVKDLARTGNALPAVLKQQLVALGFWSMQYSVKAMCERLPVEPLIEVNRNIAEGLRAQEAAPAATPLGASIAV